MHNNNTMHIYFTKSNCVFIISYLPWDHSKNNKHFVQNYYQNGKE